MAGLLLRVASLLSVAAATSHPVIVGQTFMAGGQDPTKGSTPWALVSHGIAEKLFTVNKQGDVVAQLAQSVTKVDKFTWHVTLTSGYKFSDGTAVTADHIVTALIRQNTENGNGNDALGTMTVTKADESKIQIKSSVAHPAMDAALANWVFVISLKKGSNYLYTGPFAVQSFTDSKIDLIPNTHYPQALANRPEITLKKYGNGDVLANALKAGEVDLAFHLPSSRKAELNAVDGVTIKSFDIGYHYMMFHNTRPTSVLSDPLVRKAVDLAIDRNALAQELKGGSPTRSLFPSASPYFQTDSVATTADASGAAALLDQAGWTLDNGIRVKNAKQLNIYLVSYPFRPGLGIMAPLIKTNLESLGIKVNAVDVDLWSEPHTKILSDKTYDLLMWAQHTLPNGDPQWFLNSFFRSGNGNNYAGINSPAINGYLDDLALAGHANNARINAVSKVHSKVLEEVAVSNLVTPQWHIGVSQRLACYDPWGADYYVIRADLMEGSDCTSTDSTDSTASGAVRAALGCLWLASLLLFA